MSPIAEPDSLPAAAQLAAAGAVVIVIDPDRSPVRGRADDVLEGSAGARLPRIAGASGEPVS